MLNMNDVLAIVMAGGRGTRLLPLTQTCAKPAISIAGEYRLVDIPISNCINSGINRIAVLTQHHPTSLHEHIAYAYNFITTNKWVKTLTGGQGSDGANWYRGTADAVRKQLPEIQKANMKYTLILAGDHLYRMDYGKMAQFHLDKKADITIAVQSIAHREASRMGITKRASDGRLLNFVEKPTSAAVQEQFINHDNPEKPFFGSMGIYLFNTQVLISLLTDHPELDDFGSDLIPEAIYSRAVYGYAFDGYWQDIGTVRSFYEANLELSKSDSPFRFSYPQSPMVTATLALTLPHPRVVNSRLKEVFIGRGSHIFNANIEHSVIGVRSQISTGTMVKDSVVMGADDYLPEGIGANCSIEGAILDRNVRLGEGVIIRPFPRGMEMNQKNWCVRDGIVIILKNARIEAGSRLIPEDFMPRGFTIQTDKNSCFEPNPGVETSHPHALPRSNALAAVG